MTQVPWLYIGRYRSHHAAVTDLAFVEDTDAGIIRLVRLAPHLRAAFGPAASEYSPLAVAEEGRSLSWACKIRVKRSALGARDTWQANRSSCALCSGFTRA